MLRVGLTGGIACGKSHVLRRLHARGCLTLDLDRVAHELMAPGGDAYGEVVASFGERILGERGIIDRKLLGAIVFADGAARERLNGIVHPHVRREERRRFAGLARGEVAVTDAALLVESGLHLRFDRMVVVHCSEQEQLRRLMARDSLSQSEARARLAAQMPLAEKRRFAHLEIDSSGRPEDTDASADALAERLHELAGREAAPRVVEAPRLLGALSHAAQPALCARLLEELSLAGGLEMPRVAALVGRGAQGWLARSPQAASVRALDLAAPVVAWVLARRGEDLDLLGLCAMSVARAVGADPVPVGEACATAWLMARSEARSPARIPPDAMRAALAFGQRWSGGALAREGELVQARPLAGWLAGAAPAAAPAEAMRAVEQFMATAAAAGSA